MAGLAASARAAPVAMASFFIRGPPFFPFTDDIAYRTALAYGPTATRCEAGGQNIELQVAGVSLSPFFTGRGPGCRGGNRLRAACVAAPHPNPLPMPEEAWGEGTHAWCTFTYSKSPGLLSMPALGGAIQDANLPRSQQASIKLAMKSPSTFDGSHWSLRLAHSASVSTSPSGEALTLPNSPMPRWKATCGSLSLKLTPVFSIPLFQRSTPLLQSAT